MVKILKNGDDKKYYAKCQKCATEMEYELSDVKRETSTAYRGEIKTIKCPVCGETIQVSLLTKEEVDESRKHGSSYLGYACCS